MNPGSSVLSTRQTPICCSTPTGQVSSDSTLEGLFHTQHCGGIGGSFVFSKQPSHSQLEITRSWQYLHDRRSHLITFEFCFHESHTKIWAGGHGWCSCTAVLPPTWRACIVGTPVLFVRWRLWFDPWDTSGQQAWPSYLQFSDKETRFQRASMLYSSSHTHCA